MPMKSSVERSHVIGKQSMSATTSEPIAKGPLTLTDMISYQIGVGWGAYGGGTSKIGYKNRMRVPGFYVANDRGIPDTVQRCHWEDAYAQQLGHPAAYDYGTMRTNWMVHLVTNWMGDLGLALETQHLGHEV